jgi:hypothetical protein
MITQSLLMLKLDKPIKLGSDQEISGAGLNTQMFLALKLALYQTKSLFQPLKLMMLQEESKFYGQHLMTDLMKLLNT